MKKVIDIEERIPSMKEQRRRKTNRKFIFVLIVFIFILFLILYFQSSLSRIDQIKISGAKLYDKTFYYEESDLIEGGPLWGFSTGKTESILESLESVQSATVSRKWFRDVQINIVEWETIAYIEEGEKYKTLLEDGHVLTSDSASPIEEAPVLNGFTDLDVRSQLVEQLLAIESEVYYQISEIIYTGTADYPLNIKVYMDDGNEVRGVVSTFANQIKYYPEMVAQLSGHEKGIIDLEVGAYFIPYSQIYGFEGEEENDWEEDEFASGET